MRRTIPISLGLMLVVVACQATRTPENATSTTPEAATSTTPETVPSLETTASFVVIGDFGDGSKSEYAIAAAVRRSVADRPIDGLITTGDNFYSNDVAAIWDQPYGWLEASGIDVIAAWGNHDVQSPRRIQLVQEELEPDGRWFSRSVGSGRLIVLDSTQVTNPDQTRWLENELAASDAPVIVDFHHPAFSCGSHGSTREVQESWVPLFAEYEVDLVLNGHDHDYERFEDRGTTYVVTGGGGRGLRSFKQCPANTPEPSVANDTDHHFVRLDITAGRIDGTVLTDNGETIDVFAIDY